MALLLDVGRHRDLVVVKKRQLSIGGGIPGEWTGMSLVGSGNPWSRSANHRLPAQCPQEH